MQGEGSAHGGQHAGNRGGFQPPHALPREEMPWPFDADAYRMTMGLRALDLGAWTTVDSAAPELLAERHRLLRDRPAAVLGRLAGTADAEAELLDLMIGHLTAVHPDLYATTHGGIVNGITGRTIPLTGRDPLESLNALVPEDYCLLRREEEGWVLSAAILCFPNRWKLAEKLGRPLLGVHAPVPGYDRVLAGPVDRFLDGLRPGKGAWRTNWALNDDPALFQPEETSHRDPRGDITAENAGDRLFLRVERQTLVKLPQSGAAVFGIRTYQRRIGALSGEMARQLASVLASVPPDSARYKGLHRTRELALAVLVRTV